MNLERVVFGFVIILALSFTFAFTVGEIDNPAHHNVWLLTIAILWSLVSTLIVLPCLLAVTANRGAGVGR